MAKNGISTLPTKQDRLIAKLELAQTKRQLVGTTAYRDLRYYDLSLLPTQYDGNTLVNNPNVGGLVQGRPWKTTPNTVVGLWRTHYNAYFDGDWTWFDAHTPASEGEVTDFSVDDVMDSSISVQWLGYFRAPHTAVYNFYLTSDDKSIFWLGDKAITGYDDGNWDVYTDYESGEVSAAPMSLVAGQYYPIRLQYGNSGGPGNITLSWDDDYVPPPVIQVADLQYAGAQWTGSPVLDGATYTNAGWDYIGFNNAGLYEALFSLLSGDGRLAVTWSAGSTVTTGYVNVNFDGNTTFQFVPVIDAGASDNYPGTWVFPATFSAIP